MTDEVGAFRQACGHSERKADILSRRPDSHRNWIRNFLTKCSWWDRNISTFNCPHEKLEGKESQQYTHIYTPTLYSVHHPSLSVTVLIRKCREIQFFGTTKLCDPPKSDATHMMGIRKPSVSNQISKLHFLNCYPV